MSHNYFIFTESSCVGCEACVVACVIENGFQFPNRWRNIYSSNEKKIPGLPLFNLSLACNHCEDAPCMNYCPALAFSRDVNTGAVFIDSEKCIGCEYCIWNCPYEAPKYNPVSKVIEKCNFCNSRISENIKPACASLCPTGALEFSFDKIDKSSIPEIIKVPENPDPSIVIKKLVKNNGPEMDMSLFEKNIQDQGESIKSETKLLIKKEYPLLIFTMIVSFLVAVSASDILQEIGSGYNQLFLLSGAVAAIISILHLGHKLRFLRSVLNFKQSWLSREIVFFSVFYFLSFINLMLMSLPKALIVASGLALLLSIDMIYKPLQWKWKMQWHSGQVTIIATSLFLLINEFYMLLLGVMIIRLLLAIIMWNNNKSNVIYLILRIIMPVIAALLLYSNIPAILIILTFSIGEIIDRMIFYNDLELHEIR